DEAQRDHDLQTRDRVLQIAKLSDPFHAETRWQRHLGRNLLLRLLDGTAEIAVANAELDRQVTLLLLAIDIRCAGQQLDRGNVAQWNLHQAVRTLRRAAGGILAGGVGVQSRSVRAWHRDLQISNVLEALAVFRRETHHDREMPVAARLVEI